MKWSSKITCDDSNPKHDGSNLSLQAIAAKEILILYKWWTEERPKRIEPYEKSGYIDYMNKANTQCDHNDSDFFLEQINNLDDETKLYLDQSLDIQQKYDDEDTDMLIRLIKIRKDLWI